MYEFIRLFITPTVNWLIYDLDVAEDAAMVGKKEARNNDNRAEKQS